jgi:pimeloyl-ACP methyl ester carboxylesterase
MSRSRPITAPRIRTITWVDGPKELSLRERCRGGAIRDIPIERPVGHLQRSRRVVLLIHGFNVDMCAAGKSYDTFADGLVFRWKARSIRVYWPGDAAPQSERRLARSSAPALSAASYPYQPVRAEKSAEILAEHIGAAIKARKSSRQNPIRLSVVAHSLGCRVALELLRNTRALVAAGELKIEVVVLMAAAVPLYDVGANGSYDLSRSKAQKTVIYYSGRDTILKRVFPFGQRTYSRDPTSFVTNREALGFVGPAGTLSASIEKIEVSHRHGDYWGDRQISLRVMHELDGHQRLLSGRILVARALDSGRSVEARTIAARGISGLAADHGCRCP